ncbi:hypothetical protein R6K88_08420 [Enterococcus faecium]|nr:hypothetical protein [Enterococcus faecium]MDW3624323.1 hypothetical protein [Enterococcus faecium]
MGYNKYGGLDMTIENIPRIKEEIERFEKGESTFSAATIRKYQRKLETLEQLKERSEKGKENLLPEVQARSLSEKRSKDFMRKDVALFEKQRLHQKIKNESKVVKSK